MPVAFTIRSAAPVSLYFVGAAPELLYIKDTNGDGKADIRNVILSGFGKDKAGE